MRILPFALLALAFTFPISAQDTPPSEKPKLTPEQIANITQQLIALETEIQRVRGDSLGQILTKLRAAAASDAAAMKLFDECVELVTVERKDLDSDEAKRVSERNERNSEGRGSVDEDRDGDFATAVRLQLQFIVLTLEAHDTKDKGTMQPKIQSYVQDLLAAAPKLKGRALQHLRSDLKNGNPVVEAFRLDPYLDADDWSPTPGNLGAIWAATVLPWYLVEKPEELATQWDNRITGEATLRQAYMPEPEYALWLQTDLPTLKWERAEYLYQNGPTPINAMADMLKIIKEYPVHANSPKWLEKLRMLVDSAADAGA